MDRRSFIKLVPAALVSLFCFGRLLKQKEVSKVEKTIGITEFKELTPINERSPDAAFGQFGFRREMHDKQVAGAKLGDIVFFMEIHPGTDYVNKVCRDGTDIDIFVVQARLVSYRMLSPGIYRNGKKIA